MTSEASEAPEAPIPAGRAQEAITAALADVVAAVARFEAVAMAVARQLDATAIAAVQTRPGVP